MTRRQAKWREANKVSRDLDRNKDACTGQTSCRQLKADPHVCPYAEDIDGNYDPNYCTCCDACTEDCADDI